MPQIRKFVPTLIKPSLLRFLYEKSVMSSQVGQDYWVYGEVFNEKKEGYFVDIGAYDGINISNTYILEARYGWSGICIEANPITFEKLRKVRQATCLNVCLDSVEGETEFALRDSKGGIIGGDVDNKDSNSQISERVNIQTTLLSHVLDEQSAPTTIDYLSIDVEGAEERILAGFNFQKYTFRCITIERPTVHLRSIFADHGYILIKEIPGLDCFYIHQSFLQNYRDNIAKFYRKRHIAIRWSDHHTGIS